MPLDDSASALSKLIDDATQTVTGRISGNVGGKVNVRLANGQRINGKNYLDAIAFSGCDTPGNVTCFKTQQGWVAVGEGRQSNSQTIRQYRRSGDEREVEVKECPILAYKTKLKSGSVYTEIDKIQYWLGGDRVPVLLKELDNAEIPYTSFSQDPISFNATNANEYGSVNVTGQTVGGIITGTFSCSSSGGEPGASAISVSIPDILVPTEFHVFPVEVRITSSVYPSLNSSFSINVVQNNFQIAVFSTGAGNVLNGNVLFNSSLNRIGSLQMGAGIGTTVPSALSGTYEIRGKKIPYTYISAHEKQRFVWIKTGSEGTGYYFTIRNDSVLEAVFIEDPVLTNEKDWRRSSAFIEQQPTPDENPCVRDLIQGTRVNLYKKQYFYLDENQILPGGATFINVITSQSVNDASFTERSTSVSNGNCVIGTSKTKRIKVYQLGGEDIPNDLRITGIAPIVYKK